MDRAEYALVSGDDEQRPLTEAGQVQAREVAQGLRALLPKLDAIWTSPLMRARQTAEILSEVYAAGEPVLEPCLAPDHAPSRLEMRLRECRRSASLALVGHRPDLEFLATWMIAGVSEPALRLKKSGAALVEFSNGVACGRGALLWLLTPRQARQLRKR